MEWEGHGTVRPDGGQSLGRKAGLFRELRGRAGVDAATLGLELRSCGHFQVMTSVLCNTGGRVVGQWEAQTPARHCFLETLLSGLL